MKGFDPKFSDPTDFILGVTKEIWEDRGVNTLRTYYSDDVLVRSPAGIVVGNTDVISATLSTLAEFPDRQLLGQDVIWSEYGDGFLSSHRIISTATHTGHGVYGAPTGKQFRYQIIADCAAENNQIYDEWLIRDQGAIVRQLGMDPRDYAQGLIDAAGGPEHIAAPYTPRADIQGRYQGQGNDNEWGRRYESVLESVMAGDLGVVKREYDRAIGQLRPGGVDGVGWDEVDHFWLGLRASFPNAEFTVHHRIGRHDELMAPRAAIRWSLDGTHSGWGAFGPPTGAEVHLMGISHAEFGPGGLRREWVLFDETAIWIQILLQTS